MLNLCLFCSDGTLNPNGVRFGSSEIYNIGEPWTLPVEQGVGVRNDKRNLKKLFCELKLNHGLLYIGGKKCHPAIYLLSLYSCDYLFSKRLVCSYYWQQECSVSVLSFGHFSLFSPFNWTNFTLICPHHFLFCLLAFDSSLSFPILSAVEAFEEVTDSLCVPQYNADGEERVVLFLKMAPGRSFTPDLVARIKVAIRKALSARHVPALLLETKDIPVRENIN